MIIYLSDTSLSETADNFDKTDHLNLPQLCTAAFYPSVCSPYWQILLQWRDYSYCGIITTLQYHSEYIFKIL